MVSSRDRLSTLPTAALPSRTRGALALLTMLASTSCQAESHVRLVFVDEDPSPFRCEDEAGVPLATRALDDVTVSVVVDYLDLGGVPSCRSSSLLRWCRDQGCAPITAARACVEVTVAGTSGDPARFASQLADNASLVTEDAPDGPVLVRVLAVDLPCDVIMAADARTTRFPRENLIACGTSCPVTLDSFSGDLELDLDTNQPVCALDDVDFCANAGVVRE